MTNQAFRCGSAVARGLVFAVLLVSAMGAMAQAAKTYRVTVQNLTKGQGFSPTVVVSHTSGPWRLFELGQPVTPEVARLCEYGGSFPLFALLGGIPTVGPTVRATTGMVQPGQSQSVDITTDDTFELMTVTAMLGWTTDGIYAVNGINVASVTTGQPLQVAVSAIDCGSEHNSELNIYVGGGLVCPLPAEGYAYVHNGIYGTGDLDPFLRDWRNPVAMITIELL